MFWGYNKKKKEKKMPLFEKAGVKIKKQPNLVDKLDKVFSKFIRLRDTMPNGYFRCISCGEIKPFAKADCGHFFSRSHMSTRYDEDNCHAECSYCNRMRSDHLIGYRENLIRKIGQKRYDILEWKHNETKHYTDFDLKDKIKYYQDEVKKLKQEKGL